MTIIIITIIIMMIKVYTKVHIPSNGHNNINHGDRDHVDDDSDHQ